MKSVAFGICVGDLTCKLSKSLVVLSIYLLAKSLAEILSLFALLIILSSISV